LIWVRQTCGSWKRSALLVPETPFRGDRASFGGYLDLYAVQALMNNFAIETGVRNSEFTLTVTPAVKLGGSVAGAPLTQQFAPPLVFKVSADEMSLDQPLDKADPLQPAQAGQVTRPVLAANVLPLPVGINLPVRETRLLSLVALVVALSATAMFGLPVLAARRGDEPARIHARYGGMLLDVHGATEAIPEQRIVEVRRPDDLARIAEREGRMILHSNGSDVHQYLVSDGEIVYRYLAHAGTGAKREG